MANNGCKHPPGALAAGIQPLPDTHTHAPTPSSPRPRSFFSLVLASVPSDMVDLGFPRRFEHVDHSRLLSIFPVGSPQLDFLARMTQADPRHRMTAREALEHAFLAPLVAAAAGATAASGAVGGGGDSAAVPGGDVDMA
jgi:hypothetical protein